MIPVPLSALNTLDRASFAAVCGRFFEGSPWIAERAWAHRPFASREALHGALVREMREASIEERLALIAAHPDLAGALARGDALSPDSRAEQRTAGLEGLVSEEIALFDSYNAAYKEKFGFPFVICARENKKEAILAAFTARRGHTRAEEIDTALGEIAAIARARLFDTVEEG